MKHLKRELRISKVRTKRKRISVKNKKEQEA